MNTTASVLVLFLCALGPLVDAEKECTPGETKKLDCNTCFCSDSGIWGCTLMGCRTYTLQPAPTPGEEANRVRRSEGHCTPNTTFKKDCNTCSCNRDGTAAVCTLKACLSRSKREVSCTPGATYKEGCNICRCRSDGKSGACTRKICPVDSN
ncbi:protease inhibitors-like [Schistocerca gregaria]|uniref:protease inhibitors-like n=1 Tax=Schistocerca gregaria TaxID=7010 RepID=UPI00211ED1E7|nr:protease inhibitors-like [Schistocerca gregaria]